MSIVDGLSDILAFPDLLCWTTADQQEPTGTQPAMQTREQEAREWVDRLLSAWAETGPGSIDRFLTFLNGEFSGFGTGEHDRYVTPEDVRAMMIREQRAMPYPIRYTAPWLDIRLVNPDVVLVEGLIVLTIETGDEEIIVKTRMSMLGVHHRDKWLLSHFHFSLPDDTQTEGATLLDSLRAKNRLLEAEVERRTAELNASLSELKAMQAQLVQQEKMASLGALTAGIAHEIKNPLNFVNNFAAISAELIQELIEEQDENERQVLIQDLTTNLTKIGEHGRRADNIVRSMLEHSRGTTGERVSSDINSLVSEYVELARHGYKSRGDASSFDISVVLDPTAGEVELVPQEIGRVLLNLLGNALDAVCASDTENGNVVISTHRDASFVEIRVADNGGGIPPDQAEKIFEPFFTTKPAGQGTGLGLSLSYDIISQGHRGSLTLENEPGRGATFIVRLPDSA